MMTQRANQDDQHTNLGDETESRAIEAAKTDPAAFTPLYRAYLRPVFRYLYSRTGSRRDAEDLTSQVFMETIESLPRYQHRGHFQAWLFSIARHRLLNFYARRPSEEPIGENRNLTAAGAGPLARAIEADEIRRLSQRITALDEDDQEVLRLRFVAELSYAEIGAVLERSEGAVKKQTYRLLARLKRQLENDHD